MNAAPSKSIRKFQRCFFVYIYMEPCTLDSRDDMRKRMIQHKSGTFDGFTRKYKIDRLMYFETYTESKIAAHREKQIKKIRREKKIALFAGSNPEWKDLTPELFQTIGIPPLRQAQGRDFRKSKTASPSNQP